MTEQEIIELIEGQRDKTGLSEATLTERAVGNSRLYARLKAGGGCSTKTVARLKAYFETHGPQEAAQ